MCNEKTIGSFSASNSGAVPRKFKKGGLFMTSRVQPSKRGFENAHTRGGLALVVLVLGVLATRPAQAVTYNVLYNFMRSTDGGVPNAGVVRDSVGNLYGTTLEGGDLSCSAPDGCGTVFMWNAKTHTESVLHSFTGPYAGGPGADGAAPYGGLVLEGGFLYGTTAFGGSSGAGVVFKVSTSGAGYTVLYNFCSQPSCADGGHPYAGLVRGSLGKFYGTTLGGGAPSGGVAFELDTTTSPPTETPLHSFGGYPKDGASPYAGLVLDAALNLYGTTAFGGAFGDGVAFKFDTTTSTYTLLHTFRGAADGGNPYTTLLLSAGNLYGMAQLGGTVPCGLQGCGVVFKIFPTETVQHSFGGVANDGVYPTFGRLVSDSLGNLYGTTPSGGTSNAGVVFELDTMGVETILHPFTGGTGGTPSGALIRDSAGNLYGTTQSGGTSGYGVIFELTP